jgi:glutathione S-transferase
MQVLEDYLSTRSYIWGFEPTTSDNFVFEAVNKTAEVKSGQLFPNLRRWHHHIESFGNERKKFVVI